MENRLFEPLKEARINELGSYVVEHSAFDAVSPTADPKEAACFTSSTIGSSDIFPLFPGVCKLPIIGVML